MNQEFTDHGSKPETRHGPSLDVWPAPMLIDAHAHLYDNYDLRTYFESTFENIREAGRARGVGSVERPDEIAPGCLLLAEPTGMNAFAAVRDRRALDSGDWRFVPCQDGLSLIAQRHGRDALILIAGRQIKTREGLEVLSLCSDKPVPGGRDTVWTLQCALDQGGLAVLPVGAGKWLGSRGRIVDEILSGPLSSRICLGDNAGRLARRSIPRQFVEARDRGVWVLPGSGALPFRSQQKRVGRYGLILEHRVDRAQPAASIRAIIRAGGDPPQTYGRPDGLWDFLRLQTAMQVYKRVRET